VELSGNFRITCYVYTRKDVGTVSCELQTWKDIASICASCAAILGILGAAWGAKISISIYKNNNSIRRIDLIHKLYNFFLEKEMYDFYEIVKSNKPFDLDTYAKVLNQSLTFFDEFEYYSSRELIDKKSLEYFAAEILNFQNNDTVMKYVQDTEIKYNKLHFHPDIVPFSGFTALIKRVQKEYKYKNEISKNT